jgi:hypothetical protein
MRIVNFGRRRKITFGLLVICLAIMMNLPTISLSESSRIVSANSKVKSENRFLQALELLPKFVDVLNGFLKNEVDKAKRRKLSRRLLILSDDLSSLENTKRLLNQSLMVSDPDFTRAVKNLRRLDADIRDVIEEIKSIRTEVPLLIPQGEELERQLTDALINPVATVDQMLQELYHGQKVDLKHLREESDKTIRLVHQAQDAVIKLSNQLNR